MKPAPKLFHFHELFQTFETRKLVNPLFQTSSYVLLFSVRTSAKCKDELMADCFSAQIGRVMFFSSSRIVDTVVVVVVVVVVAL